MVQSMSKASAHKLRIIDTEVTMAERMIIMKHFKLETSDTDNVKRFEKCIKQRLNLPESITDLEKQVDLTSVEMLDLNDCALKYVQLKMYGQLQFLLLRGNRIANLTQAGNLLHTYLTHILFRHLCQKLATFEMHRFASQ